MNNMKLLVILLVVISAVALGAAPSINLVEIHKDTKANAAECVTCHNDVLAQESSDPEIKAFHPLHLESSLLKMQCVDCHVSVDLSEGSGAMLRKQVDPEFCANCHSRWSNKMDAGFRKMDCTTCHADWQEKMADVTFVNVENVTLSNCWGCHGGRALYDVGPKEGE